MNRSLLLHAMIAKELRSIFRDRQQILGLVISIIILVGVVATVLVKHKFADKLRPPPAAAATAPATQPPSSHPAASPTPPSRQSPIPTQLQPLLTEMIVRWVAIAVGTTIALFFGLGYLIAATLATFAGEKDDRTLEILLASPIPDTTLFLTKCASVLLPMSAIGYLFLLIPSIVAVFVYHEELAFAPVCFPVYALLLSVPVMLLLNASIVAIGAAISVKAQSLKSASQTFGAIIFIVIFGGAYGLPLILKFTRLGKPAADFGTAWLSMPFPLQYALALAILALPTLLFTLVARSLFQRDRLLS